MAARHQWLSVELKKAIKQSGLQQAQIAEQLGVTGATVSRWATGQSSPDLEKIPQLERLLGVSLSRLDAVPVDELAARVADLEARVAFLEAMNPPVASEAKVRRLRAAHIDPRAAGNNTVQRPNRPTGVPLNLDD